MVCFGSNDNCCGQYRFDERIRGLADEEISIGDYILSGEKYLRYQ